MIQGQQVKLKLLICTKRTRRRWLLSTLAILALVSSSTLRDSCHRHGTPRYLALVTSLPLPGWASQAQNWSPPCAGRVPLERCSTVHVRPVQRVHCVPPARLARLSCFSNLFFRLVSPAQCQPVIRAGRARFLRRPMTCFRALPLPPAPVF
ncbi:hypothetical protein M441DRAFT_248191 [Trichoderma asperellum CBS 433.97]|uniref:Uncharacterized protein n=1 Tax=Trichoderma asperellum (strain ATCC 204424 / CBS 433.97 / NBRC 101777) TaxID=1042311 RepID=A0A2T3Z066_TRIA4|nr:hypothetical protein M441DRAFT_248191 [Trichoderma asperellum CBS 433.97]PTB38187.1 hypothetical protein M441DRAFT_248191 [Trichoderma asperellum CBS 433.97]